MHQFLPLSQYICYIGCCRGETSGTNNAGELEGAGAGNCTSNSGRNFIWCADLAIEQEYLDLLLESIWLRSSLIKGC